MLTASNFCSSSRQPDFGRSRRRSRWKQLDSELVSAFLEYLEDTRRNAPETRNVRLAANKILLSLPGTQAAGGARTNPVVFWRYRSRKPPQRPWCLISSARSSGAVGCHPIQRTRDGIRDEQCCIWPVCAGLRVSELTGLRTGDVTLPSMSIRILGKGRRERVLPLWKTTARRSEPGSRSEGRSRHPSCLSVSEVNH